MSDPVTNVEIEDVLSSIRRLVSQDSEPPKPEAAEGVKPEATESIKVSKAPEALILTEDHRIDAARAVDEARAAVAQATAEASALREKAASAARSELEKAIEELEAAMGIDADDKPEVLSDDSAAEQEIDAASDDDQSAAAEDMPAPVSTPEDDAVDMGESEPAQLVAEPDDPNFVSPDIESSAQEDVPHAEFQDDAVDGNEVIESGEGSAEENEDVAEAPDPQIEEMTDAFAFSNSEDDTVSSEGDTSEDHQDFSDEMPGDGAEETAHDQHDQEPPVDHEPGVDESHEVPEADMVADAKEELFVPKTAVEVLQLVSNRAETEAYDERYEGDVLDGATLEIDEDTEVAATGARDDTDSVQPNDTVVDSEIEAELNDTTPQPEMLAEQPIEFDEEMLRDMVAEIVRSELQGELGERITRNVRKLVRREINRALAGQDLI